MQIVAIASQKGGVGKSTLCIHLAAEAVRTRKGRKRQVAVILEVDRQGTASLLWNERRAKRLRPDDMVKDVDPNVPQPEVRRVDSASLEKELSELARSGCDLAVLDLPGTHSPAVNKAIAVADYTLIPCPPNDVDLQPSLETADVARRLGKRFAYVLTKIPRGVHALNMRDHLEDSGFTVAPGGLGDRASEFRVAIENGMTVQEYKPNGESTAEVRSLWKWLEKELGSSHGRKA